MKTKSDKYKYVYFIKSGYGKFKPYWSAQICINGVVTKTHNKDEREAALSVDKMLISKGRKPVNILKAK